MAYNYNQTKKKQHVQNVSRSIISELTQLSELTEIEELTSTTNNDADSQYSDDTNHAGTDNLRPPHKQQRSMMTAQSGSSEFSDTFNEELSRTTYDGTVKYVGTERIEP